MTVDLVGVYQVGRFIETTVESLNICILLSLFIIIHICKIYFVAREILRALQYSIRVATL